MIGSVVAIAVVELLAVPSDSLDETRIVEHEQIDHHLVSLELRGSSKTVALVEHMIVGDRTEPAVAAD